MFEIGWSELLVIAVVALIAIGPKELPGALRAMGHWMGKVRRMASEFQGQFQEAMREAEMADLKKQVDDITSAANNIGNFDPIENVRHEVETMQNEVSSALDPKPADTATALDASVTAPTPPTPELPTPELATPGEPAPNLTPQHEAKPATGERS